MDETPDSALGALMYVYGHRCQLTRNPANGLWVSVEFRSPTEQRVIVAPSVQELGRRLDAEYGTAG